MKHETDSFFSSGGLELLGQRWLPEGEPRGVVAIVHGYAEHSGRYGGVAGFLTSRGYVVEAFDLRGHGQSDGSRVLVRSANEYLVDTGRFLRRTRELHPGQPLFLLGHSMGGLISTLYVITRRPDLSGLVLSGPGIRVEGVSAPLKLAARAMAKVAPGFGVQPLDATAISKDAAVVEAYRADPLVYTGKMKAGLGAAMLRAIDRVDRDMEAVELPLLIMHGRDDRLAPASGSEELYARAASNDKTLKLYDGLNHEIFNEPEREQVLSDLAAWLDAHTTPGGAG